MDTQGFGVLDAENVVYVRHVEGDALVSALLACNVQGIVTEGTTGYAIYDSDGNCIAIASTRDEAVDCLNEAGGVLIVATVH